MSKASVLARVQTLSTNQADQTACDRFYDETVLDLARRSILVNATLLAAGPALDSEPQHSYLLPLTAVVPLQFIYDDEVLPELSRDELLSYDPSWRDLVKRPIGVERFDVGLRRFRLVPQPIQPTPVTWLFMFGAPFGIDYPDSVVGVIHTETRQDLPDYLEPAVTWLVLAKEFERESDHQNLNFAARCASIGQKELEMVV